MFPLPRRLQLHDDGGYVGKGNLALEFHNTGLYNIDGKGASGTGYRGARDQSRPGRHGAVPGAVAANIAVTAPYMHDGSIPTLEGVVAHYEAGGRTIADGPAKGIGAASPLKSPFVKGFTLTAADRADLVAFLESLTDRGSSSIRDSRIPGRHTPPSAPGR